MVGAEIKTKTKASRVSPPNYGNGGVQCEDEFFWYIYS